MTSHVLRLNTQIIGRQISSRSTTTLIIFRIISAIFAVFLLPGVAEAKFQRMMLMPQSATIAAGSRHQATAFCLDQHLPTPKGSDRFSAVAAPFSNISIEIGGKTYSYTDALAQGFIEGIGADTPGAVEIVNKTSSDIKFTVKSESILLPDAKTDINDLPDIVNNIRADGFSFNHPMAQLNVWKASNRVQIPIFIKQLGLDITNIDHTLGAAFVQQAGAKYIAFPATMQRMNDLVRTGRDGNGPLGFVVQQIDGEKSNSGDPAPPMFVLYFGGERPAVEIGVKGLWKLQEHANAAWKKSGGKPPPRLMVATPSTHANDALATNYAAAAIADGATSDVSVLLAQLYKWDVPQTWREAFEGKPEVILDVAERWPRGSLVLSKRDAVHSATIKLPDMEITVRSRLADLLAQIVAAVRNFYDDMFIFASVYDRTPEFNKFIIQSFKDHLKMAVDEYYLKYPDQTRNGVQVEGSFLGQIINSEYAKNDNNPKENSQIAGNVWQKGQ